MTTTLKRSKARRRSRSGVRFTRQNHGKKQTISPNRSQLYNRARYYDPAVGIFIGRDPLEYVDGASLYRGYFATNGMKPLGVYLVSQEDLKKGLGGRPEKDARGFRVFVRQFKDQNKAPEFETQISAGCCEGTVKGWIDVKMMRHKGKPGWVISNVQFKNKSIGAIQFEFTSIEKLGKSCKCRWMQFAMSSSYMNGKPISNSLQETKSGVFVPLGVWVLDVGKSAGDPWVYAGNVLDKEIMMWDSPTIADYIYENFDGDEGRINAVSVLVCNGKNVYSIEWNRSCNKGGCKYEITKRGTQDSLATKMTSYSSWLAGYDKQENPIIIRHPKRTK